MRQESPSRRGDIYDRSGVVVLATTVDRERLAAMPSELDPQPPPARSPPSSSRILRLEGDEADAADDADVVRQEVRRPRPRPRPDDRPTGSGRRSRPRTIEAVALEPEPVRVYPHEGGGPDSTLAAQLLGFVNRDGDRPVRRRAVLPGRSSAGRPRIVHAQRDVAARAIPDTIVVEDAGAPGEDIRLTIDAGLQLALEQEVLAAWAADKAKSVSAVVMDPYTGEVLAEATYPSYDANDYQAIAAIDPIALHRPGRQLRLRARLGLQDADRDRRPRDARPSRRRRRSRTSGPSSSTAAGPTSTTPTTRARAG